MINLDLKKIFLLMSCLSLVILIAAFVIYLTTSKISETDANSLNISAKLQYPFSRSDDEYNNIGEPVLQLSQNKISQIPDLRNILIFHGINNRPDMQNPKNPTVTLSLRGANGTLTIPIQEKAFISYDSDNKRYIFTHKSPLEANFSLLDQLLNVIIQIVPDNINSLEEEYPKATFKLKKTTLQRRKPWKIDGLNVDNNLFLQQKAQWYGKDLFLETHGGEDFKLIADKERIDFNNKAVPYSIFAKEKESFIWKDSRWQEITLFEDTLSYPLLYIDKIEERMMNISLWSPNGKIENHLHIVKSRETWSPSFLESQIKFIGSKTTSQAIVEINNNRTTITANDWIIYYNKEWTKIESRKQLDNYLNNKLHGELFIFKGLGKNESGPVLQGHIFNRSKTEKHLFEIPLQSGQKKAAIYNKRPHQ